MIVLTPEQVAAERARVEAWEWKNDNYKTIRDLCDTIDSLRSYMKTTFHVIAYDEGGYGDNRSKEFDNQDDAVAYARSLEKRFHPSIRKDITMTRIAEAVSFEEPEP